MVINDHNLEKQETILLFPNILLGIVISYVYLI